MYLALEGAWSDYKTFLIGAVPSKSGAPGVMTSAGKVLALAHKGTQQYEALLNKPIGKLVSVAGRQRMLSQRMAAFYCTCAGGRTCWPALARPVSEAVSEQLGQSIE